MNFKFCTHIHRIDRNISPLKISALVALGVLKDSKISRAPIYREHRAVILTQLVVLTKFEIRSFTRS